MKLSVVAAKISRKAKKVTGLGRGNKIRILIGTLNGHLQEFFLVNISPYVGYVETGEFEGKRLSSLHKYMPQKDELSEYSG